MNRVDARAKNFPTWIQTAYPGALYDVDLTKTPVTYLQNLYPNIWQYGPAGDTYMQQLTQLNTLLYNSHFLQAAVNISASLNTINDDGVLIGELAFAANDSGMPIPGAQTIYGIDDTDDTHPVEQIYEHITLENQPDPVALTFEQFLYAFTLITIHHTYLQSRSKTTVKNALNEYATFCDTWDIPQ